MAWRPQIVTTEGSEFVTGEAEFLASEHFTAKRSGITVDADTVGADENGDKVLDKGTVMGLITATGLYGAYDAGAVDGREVARGFLPESINLKYGDAVCGLVISGSVIADRCSGLDAAAKTDLAGAFTFQ